MATPGNTQSPVELPRSLVLASNYMWRLSIIVIGLYFLYRVVIFFRELLFPLSLAILLTALVTPFFKLLVSWKIPKSLAALISVILFFACLFLVIYSITTQVQNDWTDFSNQILKELRKSQEWLINGPLHVSKEDVDNLNQKVTGFIQNNSSSFVHAAQTGLLTSVQMLSQFFTRLLLVFFSAIFLLYDGARIWNFLTMLIPTTQRDKIRAAGKLGFGSLVAYVRATVVVAAVDAFGIYLGLRLTAVPLAAPSALLVFIGAFIPLVGAVVTGAVAVLVALITKGILSALITVLIIVGVMQIEGHILQPFLLGKAVELHPLAVVIAITAGAITLQIWGALIAVPLTAVLTTAIRYLKQQVPSELEKKFTEELVT